MSILIYGHISDEEIVFLPKGEAEYWAEFDKDYSTGITYGILYEKYPDIFSGLIENLCNYRDLQINLPKSKDLSTEQYFNLLFESLYENYRNDESWIDLADDDYVLKFESDARRFYENELPEDERLPLIDEIFSDNAIDYMTLYDWVGWPTRMEGWVPLEIEEKFAKKIDYSNNLGAFTAGGEGIYFKYHIEDEKELVKAFENHGYKCFRNDELIQNACG